jgi:hypothetical protein
VSDVGNVLQKAGFALPATGSFASCFFFLHFCVTQRVVDTDSFKIRFPDAVAVMELLSSSGESNAVSAQPSLLSPCSDDAAAAASAFAAAS